jgi:hypothetical protein
MDINPVIPVGAEILWGLMGAASIGLFVIAAVTLYRARTRLRPTHLMFWTAALVLLPFVGPAVWLLHLLPLPVGMLTVGFVASIFFGLALFQGHRYADETGTRGDSAGLFVLLTASTLLTLYGFVKTATLLLERRAAPAAGSATGAM